MPKFRKKPVVIEARQFVGDSPRDAYQLADWCGGQVGTETNEDQTALVPYIVIATLEGAMSAEPGDWIIEGVNGEFYPCKPDIFEKTYESVTEPVPAD